jgi:hypothetical protein
MNKLIASSILALSLLTLACQNGSGTKVETTTSANSPLEDSLYKQVLAVHDEIMPKMGKLMGYEKKAQQQMDSLKTVMSGTSLPVEVSKRLATDANTLDTLNGNLKAAEKAMNDWMDQFDPDPKMPTTEERAAYFAQQKQKADSMKTQFMQAYQQAEKFFSTSQK